MMTRDPVRLLVAEHRSRFGDALERVLDSEPGLAVVARCAHAADTVRLAEQHRPDVLLLDLDMPDGAGFDTLKRLSALPRRTRTLGLSSRVHNEMVLRALSLGARGIIEKHAPRPILFQSIRTVAGGHYYARPDHLDILIDASRTLLDRRGSVPDVPPPPGGVGDPKRFRLTRRELDIVAGIAIGESNKEIADRLLVKECTVKHHLASVFDKLGVFSRLQLAVFAIHHQLVDATDVLVRSGL